MHPIVFDSVVQSQWGKEMGSVGGFTFLTDYQMTYICCWCRHHTLRTINLSDCTIFPLVLISHYSFKYNVLWLDEGLNIHKKYLVLFLSLCFTFFCLHLKLSSFSCLYPAFLPIKIFSFIKSFKGYLFHKGILHHHCVEIYCFYFDLMVF